MSSPTSIIIERGNLDKDEGEGTIPALLREARRLQEELPALFTWEQLREIIGNEQLALLERHPTVETLYTTQFNPAIRATYGGVEAYLRAQLGWSSDSNSSAHWSRGDEVQVRINDWAYSVPKGVTHHVVWVPSPLFHPILCTPPPSMPPSPPRTPTPGHPLFPSTSMPSATAAAEPPKGSWEHVTQYGLSGMTGAGAERGERSAEEEQEGPEREIEAFVKARWPEEGADGGWETLWFANPPSLQSVRGLAHFHVLAKRKQDGERRNEARVGMRVQQRLKSSV